MQKKRKLIQIGTILNGQKANQGQRKKLKIKKKKKKKRDHGRERGTLGKGEKKGLY